LRKTARIKPQTPPKPKKTIFLRFPLLFFAALASLAVIMLLVFTRRPHFLGRSRCKVQDAHSEGCKMHTGKVQGPRCKMHTEKVQDAHQEGVRCKVQDAHWEGALAARHSAGKDPALPALTLLWSKGFHWSGSFVKRCHEEDQCGRLLHLQ